MVDRGAWIEKREKRKEERKKKKEKNAESVARKFWFGKDVFDDAVFAPRMERSV